VIFELFAGVARAFSSAAAVRAWRLFCRGGAPSFLVPLTSFFHHFCYQRLSELLDQSVSLARARARVRVSTTTDDNNTIARNHETPK
jgi:hypothetical protein